MKETNRKQPQMTVKLSRQINITKQRETDSVTLRLVAEKPQDTKENNIPSLSFP